MFTISKDFPFSGSHLLHDLPDGHPCGRLHGHNWIVRVELSGPADLRGFVVDYGELAPFKAWVDGTLDHRHVNDVPGLHQPTAEHMAEVLCGIVKTVVDLPAGVQVAVGVSETPKTWAWYRP